jgi:membrane-associated PAP2 superfamily phosphatase
MNRTGLLIALAIAAAIGIIFGLYPELDLRISRPFAEIFIPPNNTFALRFNRVVTTLREVSMWVVAALVAPAVLALVLKLILPRRRLLIPSRAIIFLIATLLLAPGLVINSVLKSHWSRSRPIDITQLGGQERFVAWWDPRGECPGNCSFVSGDVAAAFWTLAPAALAPPAWRPLAYGAALAFGAGLAFLRIAAGGHFFTDTMFAGIFTFLIIWLMHGLLYRWPKPPLTDAAIERGIERIMLPLYRSAASLLTAAAGRVRRLGGRASGAGPS